MIDLADARPNQHAAPNAAALYRMRPLWRRRGFVLAVILGLLDYWRSRFVIFSDGISYLEIARRYADGDWRRAINAYWSPLYSWILALARLLTGKNDRWELASLHIANLLAYLVALLLFERLLSYLWPHHRQNVSTNRYKCFRVCSYCLFLWATLHLIGIGYTPDMFVLAFNLAAAILLFSIQKKPHSDVELALLGSVLALTYLCKTAFFPISFVYFAIALWIGNKQGRTFARCAAMLLPFIALCMPWLIALHHHQGHWTFGESGKLNYAWEVDGAARNIHWQGEPGNIGTPLHPTRRISSNPAVYEFGSPINATYAPWFDPTYWHAGVAPGFHIRNQLKTLATYVPFVLALLCLIPGAVPAVLMATSFGRAPLFFRSLRSRWFLLVPAFTPLLMYCFVYVDSRYIAGSILVIGLVVLRSALPFLKTQSQFNVTKSAAYAVCTFFVLVWPLVGVLTAIKNQNFWIFTDQQAIIASEVRSLGLKPNDQIAYIGIGMNSYWALLDDLKITAEIPTVLSRENDLSKTIFLDDGNIDEFWKADTSTKNRIFAQMKASGVRAIAADGIPEGQATSDWIKLKGKEGIQKGLVNVYIKLL